MTGSERSFDPAKAAEMQAAVKPVRDALMGDLTQTRVIDMLRRHAYGWSAFSLSSPEPDPRTGRWDPTFRIQLTNADETEHVFLSLTEQRQLQLWGQTGTFDGSLNSQPKKIDEGVTAAFDKPQLRDGNGNLQSSISGGTPDFVINPQGYWRAAMMEFGNLQLYGKQ